MAVMAVDHGAAAEFRRHAAFKFHYPQRVIIELGRLPLSNACTSRRGAENCVRATQWLITYSGPTVTAIP
jgi:hypothetical protein